LSENIAELSGIFLNGHLQTPVFFLQRPDVESPPQRHLQLSDVYGLPIKVVCADPDRAQGAFMLIVPGYHDNLRGRFHAENLLKATEALHSAVSIGRQSQVKGYHARPVLAERREPFFHISGERHLILLAKTPFHLFPDIFAIINYQQFIHVYLFKDIGFEGSRSPVLKAFCFFT